MGSTAPSTPKNHAETRDRILDTARELFAEQGFDAVSLRQITSKAGVNIAAVNYHFGSKDALITDVLARMLTPINAERLRLLDILEVDFPDGAPIEKVLHAMYEPVILHLADEGEEAKIFLKLSGRCMGQLSSEKMTEKMMTVFKELIVRFMTAFTKSLPRLDSDTLTWRFHFSIGTKLFMLTKDENLLAFSGGKLSAMHDAEQTLGQLVSFVAGGLKADIPKVTKKTKPKKSVMTTTILAMALLLSSCAGRSPANTKNFAKLDTPKQWIASENVSSGPVADSNWIASFGDKNLTAFVEKALDQNKSLKAAASRIDAAAATARISGADVYPQINGGFSGRRSKQNFIGFPFGGDPAEGGGGGEAISSSLSNQFGLSLDLSWEIDLWGKIRAAQSAAIARFEASEADRASAELSIAAQAAKAWFAIAEAREQVALAKQTVATFTDTEEVIRGRFEGGLDDNGRSLASQLLLAESDIAVAKDSLASRNELVGRTSRQLEVLAGEYPAGKAAKNATLPHITSMPPAGLPADLLDRRPDLAAAERRLAAADMTLLEAKRTALPQLSLTSSGGTSSEDIADILSRNFSVWSLAGNAVQPILRAGLIKNGIKLRNAELATAIAEFEQTTLTAFADVENALAAEKYLRDRESTLSKAASISKRAYDQAREEYGAGTGDLLTMLTAQQRMFSQQSQAISIRRLRLENRVDLHLALGGSFKSQPAKNTITPEPAKPGSHERTGSDH